MYLRIIIVIFLMSITNSVYCQIVINEVLSSNDNGISDEDLENVDWIELYNSSNENVNLEGYALDDKFSDSTKWVFPEINIEPKSFLLVFASGKDRKKISAKSKTIINEGDEWKYIIPPNDLTNGDWRSSGFDDSAWITGQSGFGYGDDDDNTLIQPLQSIYIRKEFTIEKLSELAGITLHVDFDDAFIAFINGIAVAYENVNFAGNDYDNIEVFGDHEAMIYSGGTPSKYDIDINSVNLVEGINTIALQGYNVGSNSSDFSLIPFLTLKSTSYKINDIAEVLKLGGEGNLHTDFKISKQGESLYLFNPQLEIIDSVNVVNLPADVSYGRYADGENSWFYFTTPTPGVSNSNPIEELRNDSVIFSKPGGLYPGTMYIKLYCPSKDVVIRYTTDGTDPDINSIEYSDSIIIYDAHVIKAAAFSGNIKRGETFTQSYFINRKHQLPVISLSTDPANLFDWDSGIFVAGPNAEPNNPHYGANYWMDWEKKIHFEYFDKQGVSQINQDAGVKISGGWSRAHAQKSMALYARSKYGKGSFKYAFFNDRDADRFESILLRNSGNDWTKSMLRDGYVSELVKNLNVDRLAFQPTVVNVNGVYWGILNMREKPNEHYFDNNYGIDPDDLNLLEPGIVIVGSDEDYNEILDFINQKEVLNDNDYQTVSDKINVDCFIDYELIEIFINNGDWPGNNIKFWNTNSAGSKFRWLLYDTDFGFGMYGDHEYMEDMISFATATNGPGWPNPPWSTLLLRRMLSNEEFKNKFINRMADLINTNFSTDFLNSKLDSVASLIDSEIGAHRNRWLGNYNDWLNSIEVMYEFNKNRPQFVKEHFISYFGLGRTCTVNLSVSDEAYGQIKVNKIIPSEYPFSGTYFSDVPLTFKALNKPGYTFLKWEGDSNSENAEITLTLSGTTNLHAVFEKDDVEEFNVVINEINYQSEDDFDSGDWVEIYNVSDKTIDLNGWKLSDDDKDEMFIIPEGNILYPDDYFVICKNLETFKIVHSEVENVTGDFKFGLSSKGDFVKLMDPNNNIVDQVLYDTKSPWPTEPLSSSATLELINPLEDNSVHTNWQAGPLGGTPGTKNGLYISKNVFNIRSHSISCFPTHFSDFTTLRFYSPGKGKYLIQIIDIQGRIINSIKGSFNSQGTHYLDIFTESEAYKKGLYFVKVQTQTGIETIRVIKY